MAYIHIEINLWAIHETFNHHYFPSTLGPCGRLKAFLWDAVYVRFMHEDTRSWPDG